MQLTGTFADSLPEFWLPHKPLAGESKAGGYQRMNRELALQLPYFEANPLCLQSLVIVDHDGADADHKAELMGLPAPSYVALNGKTNAGHIAYALAAPVCLTDSANRKPVNLLARIESGLTTILDGDVAYGGRITKNPYHQDHLPIWGAQNATYGLLELRKALDDLGALPAYDDTKARQLSGIGRNVDLFNLTRKWAYDAVRRYWGGPVSEWEEVVQARAWDRNLAVIGDNYQRGPLKDVEVTHLARSIARWTWRNMTPESFSQLQRHRRQIGIEKQRREGPSEAQREAQRTRRTKLDPLHALEVLT